jgi:hypothetical protein
VLIIVQYQDDEEYSLFLITGKMEEYGTLLLERLRGIDRRAKEPQAFHYTPREIINSGLLRKRGLTEARTESISLS